MAGTRCKCGRGHKSAYDNKCGHCRTKRERKEMDDLHRKNNLCSATPEARKLKMLYYAGIGSRETPDDVQEMMTNIGQQLADVWTLRSGFADGADKAFAFGAEQAGGLMENYVPWAGFNGAPYDDERFINMAETANSIWHQAYEIAGKHHPNWKACDARTRKLHTRNVFQVLGHDLKTHSHMVVCWTPRGSGSGGTGQAIRIARAYGIHVFDLAIEEHKQKLCDYVALQERQNFEDSLPW